MEISNTLQFTGTEKEIAKLSIETTVEAEGCLVLIILLVVIFYRSETRHD